MPATIVLVHRAFTGSASRNRVIDPPRGLAHAVGEAAR